jgi:site-specific DNA-cytosine methylase
VRGLGPAWVIGENVSALLSGREAGKCEVCNGCGRLTHAVVTVCAACDRITPGRVDVCECGADDDLSLAVGVEYPAPVACDECEGTGRTEARAAGVADVFADLCAAGYDLAWDCVPASSVGAPHRRDRVFIIAWRRDLCSPVIRASEWALREGIRMVRGEGYTWPAAPGQPQHAFEPDRRAPDPAHHERLAREGHRLSARRRVDRAAGGYVRRGGVHPVAACRNDSLRHGVRTEPRRADREVATGMAVADGERTQ